MNKHWNMKKNTYSVEYVTDPLSENAFVNKIGDLTKYRGPLDVV